MTDGGLDYTFECVGNVKTMVNKYIVFPSLFVVNYEFQGGRYLM